MSPRGWSKVTTATINREQERRFAAKRACGLADALEGMSAEEYAATVNDTEQREAVGAGHDYLATIRRALFEDAQSVWDAEGPPRVEIEGGCGLLHEGVGLYLFGPRNGGKSTTAQTLELNAAMHGVKVLHLDRENSPTLGKDRLESAIAAVDAFDADTIREFYDSRHWPHFSLAWKPEDYADAIEEGVSSCLLRLRAGAVEAARPVEQQRG